MTKRRFMWLAGIGVASATLCFAAIPIVVATGEDDVPRVVDAMLVVGMTTFFVSMLALLAAWAVWLAREVRRSSGGRA